MKMVAAAFVGVFATFGLTIAMGSFVMNQIGAGSRLPFFELVIGCPLISLVVGALIGLIAKERARAAAALGIAPWVIFLAFGAGKGRHIGPATSWWLIMLAAVSIYLGLGIVAAAFVGGRMIRADQLNP
jgi:hypothetical protein